LLAKFVHCQTNARAALGAINDSFVSIETGNAAVQHFLFITERFGVAELVAG
jgi:hypothetical protein